jgi:hypothetical protein
MSEKKTVRRFYYGTGNRTLLIDGKNVKSQQPCLVDLKDRRIAWFTFVSELGDAISVLITKFEPETENFYIREAFSKYVAPEITNDDLGSLLDEEEVLAGESGDTNVLDFFGKLMVHKEEYISSLSVIREERLKKETDELNDGFMEDETVFFSEFEEYSEHREPLFSIDDFTDRIDEVPKEIVEMYDLYNTESTAHCDAKRILAIRDEVESVFNPKLAEEKKKSRGLSGVVDTGCRDSDSCLYN